MSKKDRGSTQTARLTSRHGNKASGVHVTDSVLSWRTSLVIVTAIMVVTGLVAISVPPANASTRAIDRNATARAPELTSTDDYPPLGVSLDTEDPNCQYDGIQLGSTCYPSVGSEPTPVGDVNVLVLNTAVANGDSSPSVYGYIPAEPMWECSSTSCSSPLNGLLQDFENGYTVVISQPNSFGSACPSTYLPYDCPTPTSSSLSEIGELVPPLSWSTSSPDDLYQPWSVVYQPGCGTCEVAMNQGQTLGRTGYESDLPEGALSGSLQVDQNENLVYTSSDFVPFDTLGAGAPSGTEEMVFDGRTLGSVTPSAGESGFMVAALDRNDLALNSFQVFITNGNPNGDVSASNGQLAMAGYLGLLSAGTNVFLVAIQSFGTPHPDSEVVSCSSSTSCSQTGPSKSCGSQSDCGVYSYGPAWGRIGEAIHDLGGTMSEFDSLNDDLTTQLNSKVSCSGGSPSSCKLGATEYPAQETCGGYAFVGGPGITNPYEVFGNQVEGAGSCPDLNSKDPAQIQGVLTRDLANGLFVPYMASALPSALNTKLFTMIYPAPGQSSTAFPTYTGGEETSFNDLVGAVNSHGGERVNPDLRSSYWQDVQKVDWTTNIKYMNQFDCGSLPKADECNAVRKELVKEMTDVASVYSKFESQNSFLNEATLWAALGSGSQENLQTLANTIISATTISGSSAIVASILNVVASVFGAGASVASVIGPEGAAVGAGLGVVGVLFGIAGTIVGDESSGPYSPYEGEVQATADQLVPALQSAFVETQYRILATGEMFTTSWGLLKEMAKLIKSGALDSTQTALTTMTDGLEQSSYQVVYDALIPIAYGAGVGYDPDDPYGGGTQSGNETAVPYTVSVGQALPGEMPAGCWHGGGMDEPAYDTAELPTSGPVLDNPNDPTPDDPSDSLTALVPESTFFFVQNGGNVCGSAPSWLGEALFGPFGRTVSVSGGTLYDAGFSYQKFFEHSVTDCFVKDNLNGFVNPCGSGQSWPQYGTGG